MYLLELYLMPDQAGLQVFLRSLLSMKGDGMSIAIPGLA